MVRFYDTAPVDTEALRRLSLIIETEPDAEKVDQALTWLVHQCEAGLLRRSAYTIDALRRLVKWGIDTEDVDFYIRDNPADAEAIALLREIVL